MKPFEKKKLKYTSKDTPDRVFHDIKLKADAYFANSAAYKSANRYLVVKSILLALMVVGSYILLLHTHTIPFLFLFFILFGWLFLVIGINLGHDAAHNCLTGNKKVDNFIFQLIFGLQGISGYLWQMRHNHSHHIFPNVHGYDTDMEITDLIVLDPVHQKVKWYHKYQGYYAPFIYMIFSMIWITFQDFHVLIKKEQGNLIIGKIPRIEILKVVLIKLVYIMIFVVVPIMYIPLPAVWIIAAFITMHLAVSLFLAFTFFISHHVKQVDFVQADVENKLLHNSWLAHQINTTIDFDTSNPIANFIFGGFNTHTAHHLFPDTSHIHYPALTVIIRETLDEHGLPWYKSYTFFEGVVSHLTHLNNLVRVHDTDTTVPA